MRKIRLLGKEDVPEYCELLLHAYTGFGLSEARKERVLREFRSMPDSDRNELYGVFRDGKMTGGMRLVNYRMELRGQRLAAGGIGAVAVGQPHKKEGTARAMIRFALERFRAQGTGVAALQPFRVDYYHRLGFGYGSRFRQYRVEPEFLPDGPAAGIEILTPDDWLEVIQCHDEYMTGRDTLFELTADDFEVLFGPERRLVGCRRDGRLCGYLSLGYEKEFVFQNNLVVHEMVYLDPAALRTLLAFLRNQGDQFRRVVFNTTEAMFHVLFANPANGRNDAFASHHIEYGTDGIGVMFRVTDTAGLFRQLGEGSFGPEELRLKITVRDEFLPANSGSTVVHFRAGRPVVKPDGEWDAEMTVGVGEFSSLLVGAVDAAALLDYGLMTLSDAARAPAVARLFRTGRPPLCRSDF